MNIVADKHTPFGFEAFSTLGSVELLAPPEFSPETVRNADVLIIRSEVTVNEALLAHSAVKFVGTMTIGTDHVDLDYLRRAGIGFAAAPGSNADAVAEYVAAALLRLEEVTGTPLSTQTIGVVGVGNVGSRVVRVAQALGMSVLLNDPPLARATSDPRFQSLTGLREADVVTLHVPLTKSGSDPTVHLFNHERLRAMKKGFVLINTARGGVVDSEALKRSLHDGHVSTAVLDVWEHEPRIDLDLLRSVMIGTPHIAGHSLDGKINAMTMIYNAVCRHAGVTPQWTPRNTVPPADTPTVIVPDRMQDPHTAVREVVRRCYDIVNDDAALRATAGRSEPDRGSAFSRLRSGYLIRREFSNNRVIVPKNQPKVTACLRALRFIVEEYQEKEQMK